MKVSRPAYYDTFRCIASSCPDSCCKDWEVLVDADSSARYRALPGELGDHLRRVLRTEANGDTYLTIENGRCPMWRKDGLCRMSITILSTYTDHCCFRLGSIQQFHGSGL